MEEQEKLPKSLIGKVDLQTYLDDQLFYKTVREAKQLGLKPPTWIGWIREWSLLDLPTNSLPDPIESDILDL